MNPKDKEQPHYDFLPLTVSIETLGGVSTPLVRRGTPLPTKRSQIFSTAGDNQKSVVIEVLLGERPLAERNLRIGSCILEDLPPAPEGQLQIRVTFDIDRLCNVKVEAAEVESGKKIEATLEESAPTLTNDLIKRLLREAEENREEDHAREVMASAELRVRKDQKRNSVTNTTRKIETLIADLGVALMEGGVVIRAITEDLERLLSEPSQTYLPFAFAGMDGVFDAFFQPKSAGKQQHNHPTATQASSKPMEFERAHSAPVIKTKNITLVQSFLETVEPELEVKRAGAWEAVESNRPDGRTQAAHSMREVLRQLLDKLAPTEEVVKTPWYKKPESGASVTRAMRIRYALGGLEVASESTLNLTNDLAAAVDSMYAKLSAESHSDRRATVSATKMYLNACEAVIGLIAIQRRG